MNSIFIMTISYRMHRNYQGTITSVGFMVVWLFTKFHPCVLLLSGFNVMWNTSDLYKNPDYMYCYSLIIDSDQTSQG